MRSLTLGRAGIQTSRLGFGCVSLTSHPTRAEAVRMLEHAFACGITHFDVARAYGFGRAESILGEFLRRRRARVTVATKLGLQPPSGVSGNRWVIETAKKLLGPFPSLLRRAKRHGEMTSSRSFSSQAAIESLQTSLRELGTDCIDVLLLHEATLAEAASEHLLEVLGKQVAAGMVRSLGIATDYSKLGQDVSRLPLGYEIVQLNDNAAERNLLKLNNREGRTTITHSIFKPALPVAEAAKTCPQIVKKFSLQVGADLSDPTIVGDLLLHYALESNANGVVLFSTTNPTRAAHNVKMAESASFDKAQLSEFVEFVDEILNAGAAGSKSADGPRANAS